MVTATSPRVPRWTLALICGVGVLLLARMSVIAALHEIMKRHIVPPSSEIVDRNGRVLYEMIDPHAGSHRPVDLQQVPLALRQAIIATEDATFYQNPGLSPRAIMRALWLNLRSGRIVSGGSTITQQVARNLLLDANERQQRTWWRKLREAGLALLLASTYDKDDILALYLNQTYFGNMAYGVEAAAQIYFGKSVSELDLAECALLAGLAQAPGRYNPLLDLAAARQRQQVVLDLMVKSGFVSQEEATQAAREPLHLGGKPFEIEAPHFSMLVRSQVESLFGEETLSRGGLVIETTLDLYLQHAAEAHVKRHLEALNRATPEEPGHNVHNAAVLLLEPATGAVRVMVGSPDYFDSRISGAVNAALALRQPGSAIKPLTYVAAFERGYSPATIRVDEPMSFLTREGRPYTPINYDYRFHGPVSLRRALACSYNVIAVRILDEIGVEALSEIAGRMGVQWPRSPEDDGLALTLGSAEVSLLELTAAYAILANGGRHVSPYLIERITDREGHTLYEHSEEEAQQVLDPRVAYLVTHVLADPSARVPAFGEGSALDTPFRAAVKTGTTTDWRDNWTIGYTPDWVAGVWVGNADGSPMERISGVSGAAPIWNAVMRDATHREHAFPVPAGVVQVEICSVSGLLPTANCVHRRQEVFLAEWAPRASCDIHNVQVALADSPPLLGQAAPGAVTSFEPAVLLRETSGEMLLRDRASEEQSVTAAYREHSSESPMLRIVYPAPNSRFIIAPNIPVDAQQIEIVLAGESSSRLSAIDLLIDSIPWHRWTKPPYRVLWPLMPGDREIQAIGYDSEGRSIYTAMVHIHVLSAAQKGKSP